MIWEKYTGRGRRHDSEKKIFSIYNNSPPSSILNVKGRKVKFRIED